MREDDLTDEGRPASFAPADDEETDRIAAAVLARLAGAGASEPPPPLTIDRYINVEVHALGGMGRVFVAYDPKLERTVALKALPVGLAAHEPAAAVSRQEGKALAGIDHPNVVRVYEMVEHRGLDCLVLEHVSGVDLGVWLTSHRRTPAEILDKFVQAGEGLAAVHRAGLIHRDFKPANVIVGRDVVKLVDFGLAVRIGALAPGDPEICAGTPRFMAPEQIQGQPIGPYSDQYSFCVALYHALLRVHPYLPSGLGDSRDDDAWTVASQTDLDSRRTVFSALLRRELQRPPTPPSELPPQVLPALLRGLSLEPAARFRSMHDLLAALRDDPRQSRKRWFFGLGAVAILCALSYHMTRSPACLAASELRDRLWDGRQATIAARLNDYGVGPLIRLEATADQIADEQHELCQAVQREQYHDHVVQQRKLCLAARAAEFEGVLDILVRGDAGTVSEMVAGSNGLPSVDTCTGTRLLTSCVAREPDALAQSRVAFASGQLLEAERLARAASEAARLEDAPGPQARALIELGRIALERKEWRQAKATLRRALSIADRNGCRAIVADTYHWLTKLGAFDETTPLALAEEYSQSHDDKLAADDATGQADMLNNRALIAQWRRRDLDEASRLLHRAISLRGTGDMTVAQADSYLNLAGVLQERGQTDHAEAALNAALTRRKAALGADHPLLYKELNNQAQLAVDRRHYAQAIALYNEAIRLASAAHGRNAPLIAELYVGLTQAYDRQHDAPGALWASEQAGTVLEHLPIDDPRRLDAEEAIAQALIGQAAYPQALSRMEHLFAATSAPSPTQPEDAQTLRRGYLAFRRADALNNLERHPEAEQWARQSFQYFDDAGLPQSHPDRAYPALYLGEALLWQDNCQAAIVPLERAAAIWQATGDNPELLAWATTDLAKCLCRSAERRALARDQAIAAIRSWALIGLANIDHLMSEVAASCGPP